MAVLFAVALALIAWRASRVEPLYRPPYEAAVREGEQRFPIAVPPIEARFLPEAPASRLERLRAHSVAPAEEIGAISAPGSCELFVRVSRNHWRRHVLDPAEIGRLGADAGAGAAGDGALSTRASLSATDAVDDDDGDGERLDAGELRPPAERGAEVEIFCSGSSPRERESAS